MHSSTPSRYCCALTCLATAAGGALIFLGVFLALLGLLHTSGHDVLGTSGYILAGCGLGLLVATLLCPSGRGELHACCLQHGSLHPRGSQVGAAADDCSVISDESNYEPPPQLRVIPPTPCYFVETAPVGRPGTAPIRSSR